MRGKLFIVAVVCFLCFEVRAKDVEVVSPDGSYVFTISDDSNVSYTIDFKGERIVYPSRLGISWNGDGPTRVDNYRIECIDGMTIHKAKRSSCDSIWHPAYGERSEYPECYNEAVITLLSRPSADGGKRRASIDIVVRSYNEGVAFRYKFTGGNYLRIFGENTEFSLPEDSKAWFTPRAQTAYSLLPLHDWQGESERPLLVELPSGTYACLGEAAVIDYVRTKFKLSPYKPHTIITSMYGEVEEIAPYFSPWRVVMCGDKAGDILENNYLFLNLNGPAAFDASWIKPGKMMRETTLTTEGAFSTIDFAKKHNISYVLFDTGWYGNEGDKASDATQVNVEARRNPNPHCLDIERVVAYAKENGIGVVMYVNQRALQQQLDEIIQKFKQWGVAGIKFGFVQVGSQVWTKWLHDAVRKCGENGLLVDIHDEYRPTGVSRTYPNLMTQEGIRGNEEFPDAAQNAILPFTRYVAGAADYTICYYRQDWDRLKGDVYGPAKKKSIQNTPTHQLALSIVYYSPLQVIFWYDKPSDAMDEPELKLFNDVFTVWDETHVLEGVPGEVASIARRHGEEWFVGSIIGTDPRNVNIDLSFLKAGASYLAEIYTDGGDLIPTRTHVAVNHQTVINKDCLNFDLPPSGGVAIKLIPKD